MVFTNGSQPLAARPAAMPIRLASAIPMFTYRSAAAPKSTSLKRPLSVSMQTSRSSTPMSGTSASRKASRVASAIAAFPERRPGPSGAPRRERRVVRLHPAGHGGDALALDGVRDQQARATGLPRSGGEGRQDGAEVVAVGLAHGPAEARPLL